MMGSLPVVLVDSPASFGRLVSDPRRAIFTKVDRRYLSVRCTVFVTMMATHGFYSVRPYRIFSSFFSKLIVNLYLIDSQIVRALVFLSFS